ncbi:putative GNAT family acetyltransferase [Longispora fulva]|uniref:Putative GNAT family acetyltransferase n=2 Tax=Longispora fulva TaxID=619741 RepID=A0A8J7GFW8_9ACTN|nr:putative GNAT family acetyltransferase [Longispora fulva]
MLTSTMPVRLLGESDRADVLSLLARSPIASAQLAERIEAYGVSAWRTGGQLLGHGPRSHLEAVCWRGANVIPIGVSTHFAEVLAADRRGVGSIAGPAEAVLDLWRRLGPGWGPARLTRPDQPLLVTGGPAAVVPEPRVRLVRRRELSLLYPASVAMYTEELGVPPIEAEYQKRVASLIRARRAYAWIEGGQVLFKAELAVVTRHTAQLQGVWVAPEHRGRGIGSACLAAVVEDGLRRLAPTVSLYVNDFNSTARRVYAKCGFRQVGTFATILF